jgi:hypothetical protein
LIARTYSLDEVERGDEDLRNGLNLRGLIAFEEAAG